MIVNVPVLPGLMVCAELTCKSEGLLDDPLIVRLAEELWPTLIVAVPSRSKVSDGRFVVILQTAGVGVEAGVALGVGLGFGFGVVVPGSMGGSIGSVGSVGLVGSVGSTGVVGSFGGVVGSVGLVVSVGGVVEVVSGVGTGVAPAAKSPTLRLTFGTASSKT